MQDTTTKGNDRDGIQSNASLPRRFRSSTRWRTPAVRVGLPTSHLGATSDACCTRGWTGIQQDLIPVVTNMRVEVPGQFTDVLTTIGEEGDGLVGRHALGCEDLEQAPPGLGLDLLDEREALRCAVGGHALARDHLKPAVFA